MPRVALGYAFVAKLIWKRKNRPITKSGAANCLMILVQRPHFLAEGDKMQRSFFLPVSQSFVDFLSREATPRMTSNRSQASEELWLRNDRSVLTFIQNPKHTTQLQFFRDG